MSVVVPRFVQRVGDIQPRCFQSQHCPGRIAEPMDLQHLRTPTARCTPRSLRSEIIQNIKEGTKTIVGEKISCKCGLMKLSEPTLAIAVFGISISLPRLRSIFWNRSLSFRMRSSACKNKARSEPCRARPPPTDLLVHEGVCPVWLVGVSLPVWHHRLSLILHFILFRFGDLLALGLLHLGKNISKPEMKSKRQWSDLSGARILLDILLLLFGQFGSLVSCCLCRSQHPLLRSTLSTLRTCLPARHQRYSTPTFVRPVVAAAATLSIPCCSRPSSCWFFFSASFCVQNTIESRMQEEAMVWTSVSLLRSAVLVIRSSACFSFSSMFLFSCFSSPRLEF